MRTLRAVLLGIVGLALVGPAGASAQSPIGYCDDTEWTVEAGVQYEIPFYCENGSSVTYDVIDPPDHGTVWRTEYDSGYLFNYLADKDYSGVDTFTITFSSHGYTSEPATATLTVEPWHDDPPRCFGGYHYGRNTRGTPFHVERGGDLNLDLACNEPEMQTVTFEIIGSGPLHGYVDGWQPDPWVVSMGGGWYHHDGGPSQNDHVTVMVSDGTNKSGPFNWPIVVDDVSPEPAQ